MDLRHLTQIRLNNLRWFSSFEALLGGLYASYYPRAENTALHTDLCSPLATDPKWSRLGSKTTKILMDQGVPLWHRLVEVLAPDVVLISVARKHLQRIGFETGEPLEIARLEDGRKRRM